MANKNPPNRKDRINWDTVRFTQTGHQRVVHTNIDEDLFQMMKRFAPILVEMERKQEGAGIKNNTPSSVLKYCVKMTMAGLDKVLPSARP
jgi:hypothetical protein